MARLTDKKALVTGGARGIGRAIALALAAEGADVVIADVEIAAAEETADAIRATGRSSAVLPLDVSDGAAVTTGIDELLSEHGAIDILVNNAGVAPQRIGSTSTLEDWDACYATNVRGAWLVSAALTPQFRKQGAGKIVNIASIAGRRGGAGLAPYNASKAGVISLTQSLATELGRSNINVNAICPGLVWTDMWRHLEGAIQRDHSEEVVDRRQAFDGVIASRCPLQREQTPEDVAAAVVFLASDDARNITGQSLNVDGGMEMN